MKRNQKESLCKLVCYDLCWSIIVSLYNQFKKTKARVVYEYIETIKKRRHKRSIDLLRIRMCKNRYGNYCLFLWRIVKNIMKLMLQKSRIFTSWMPKLMKRQKIYISVWQCETLWNFDMQIRLMLQIHARTNVPVLDASL